MDEYAWSAAEERDVLAASHKAEGDEKKEPAVLLRLLLLRRGEVGTASTLLDPL